MTVVSTPDELERSIKKMASIGRCSSPSFSPDGSHLAFVSDLTGLPQVWIVPTEGGWPEPVTSLDDQVSQVTWSPDGEWLAFALAPGGGMNVQIYLIRPDGTDLRLLTSGGKENNLLIDWTHDGRSLLVGSNLRTPDAIDACLLDRESGELRVVSRNQGIGHFVDVSRDGQSAILYRMQSRSDDNLFLVDLAGGREQLLTPHEGPGSFSDAHFSPDGKTIYLSTDQQRDLVAFGRIRLNSRDQIGPIEILAARDDAVLQSFALNEKGTLAALVWNQAGRNEITFLNLETLEAIPGPQLSAEVVWTLSWSRDSRFLALTLTGSTMPMDIWVLEYASGRIWQVSHSPHAGVVLDKLVRPELVTFSAHDGLELHAWLYRPQDLSAPYPIVLNFHGGPEGQERPTFMRDYQALLSQGIAVLAPNVRGSSGFGKTFVNLDNGPLRFDAIKDIKACVDYITNAGIAIPGRIGIMGGSYGGYMTMIGLAEYPQDFAAGANLFGIVNFATFFEHTEPWMAAISKIEYGDPETQAELLQKLSPIHKIDQIQSPTLVLHGANDTNVPVIEAEQVVEHLKRRAVPVEYVLFSDEGHGFLKAANRIRASREIVSWFVRYLKG
ncbi:MAG TPA: S9 family peptidase [Ktedonobacteraceae bacterium]|nr:S9 family peptidase [Ktedonobacteraceae bacterium]